MEYAASAMSLTELCSAYFASALPLVNRASGRAQMRLRHGEVHVLQHGIDDRMFTHQQIFDFTPALQSSERVDVQEKKILPLDGVRLRQHFQCFCGPAD